MQTIRVLPLCATLASFSLGSAPGQANTSRQRDQIRREIEIRYPSEVKQMLANVGPRSNSANTRTPAKRVRPNGFTTVSSLFAPQGV